MKHSLRTELRYLLPAWLACFSWSLPFLLFWHSSRGRSLALNCFFLGCTSLVAYSFRRDVKRRKVRAAAEVDAADPTWGERTSALSVALFAAFAVFSAICLVSKENIEDVFVAPMLAFMALIPALGMTPYLTLATRKPFAAVVFTAALVGSMKLVGALIVVLIYGWDAEAQGRLGMPWDRPDLLVWLFWTFTALLSLSLYVSGAREFQMGCDHAA